MGYTPSTVTKYATAQQVGNAFKTNNPNSNYTGHKIPLVVYNFLRDLDVEVEAVGSFGNEDEEAEAYYEAQWSELDEIYLRYDEVGTAERIVEQAEADEDISVLWDGPGHEKVKITDA